MTPSFLSDTQGVESAQELWYDGGKGWISRTRTLPPLFCAYRQCINDIFSWLKYNGDTLKKQNARDPV